MQGDPSALFPLVLWLQAFVLVAVGYTWGRGRWGHWKTWIVGAPVSYRGGLGRDRHGHAAAAEPALRVLASRK